MAKEIDDNTRTELEAAEGKGVALSDPEAREIVYGMPYGEWRKKHQREASPEQKAAFAAQQQKP